MNPPHDWLALVGVRRGPRAAQPSGGMVARFWSGVAEMVCLGAMGYIVVCIVWTIIINFIVAEALQPLDFYSNKFRTRPYWLLIEVVLLGGGLAGMHQSGQTKVLNDGLPEIAIAVYLQGILIGIAMLAKISAAASMTAMLIYAFVGPGLCMVTLVPTLPTNRPGVWYGVLFFLVNMVFVAWFRVGVRRHTNQDGAPKILPMGAEQLFEAWSKAVFGWNPLLLTLTTLAYGVEYLQFKGEYGYACALGYYVIVFLLLAGCCHQFKTGTELEDDHGHLSA